MEIQQPSSVGQATALFTGLTQAQVQDTIRRIYPYRALNTNLHSKNGQEAISSTGSYTDFKEKDFIEAHRLLQGIITQPWQSIHDIESGKADPFYYDSGVSDIKDIQQQTIGRVTGASEARDPRTGFVDNLLKLKVFQKQMDNDYSYGYLTNLFQTQLENGSTYYQTQAMRQNAEHAVHTNNQIMQRPPIDHHVFLKGLPMGHLEAPHNQRKRKLVYNPQPLFTSNTRRTKLDNLHHRFTKHIDEGDHRHAYSTSTTPMDPSTAHSSFITPNSSMIASALSSHPDSKLGLSIYTQGNVSGLSSLTDSGIGTVNSTGTNTPVGSRSGLFSVPEATSIISMVPSGQSTGAVTPRESSINPRQSFTQSLVSEAVKTHISATEYEEQEDDSLYMALNGTIQTSSPLMNPSRPPIDSTMFQTPAPQNMTPRKSPGVLSQVKQRFMASPLATRFGFGQTTKSTDIEALNAFVKEYQDTLQDDDFMDTEKYRHLLSPERQSRSEPLTLREIYAATTKVLTERYAKEYAEMELQNQERVYMEMFEEGQKRGFDDGFLRKHLPDHFSAHMKQGEHDWDHKSHASHAPSANQSLQGSTSSSEHGRAKNHKSRRIAALEESKRKATRAVKPKAVGKKKTKWH